MPTRTLETDTQILFDRFYDNLKFHNAMPEGVLKELLEYLEKDILDQRLMSVDDDWEDTSDPNFHHDDSYDYGFDKGYEEGHNAACDDIIGYARDLEAHP